MPGGRPRKRTKYNISGLRNQKPQKPPSESISDHDRVQDLPGESEAHPTSTKLLADDCCLGKRSRDVSPSPDNEEICNQVADGEDDPKDSPGNGCQQREQIKGKVITKKVRYSGSSTQASTTPTKYMIARPKYYVKRPDVAAKSARTHRRYKRDIESQTRLDKYLGLETPVLTLSVSNLQHVTVVEFHLNNLSP